MAKTLIVWVPGLRLGVKSGKELLDLLCSEPEFQDAEVFSWDHKAGYLSTKYAELLGQGLASAIEGQWEDAVRRGVTYENIIVIGHSIGAVLIRHAYLIGLGSYVRNLPAKPWALKVSRIVLLAGINRGLFPPEDPGVRRAPYRMRRWLGRHIIEIASQIPILHLLAEDILAGSDFVTNLRLWWIRKFDGMENPPTVLQLVGTEDGIVRHSDSLDIEQDRAGNQIVIDQADHASIIRVRDKNGNILNGRYALIRKAVLDVFPATPSPVPEEEWARPVVFIVHGIRASNHGWVDEAGEHIHTRLNDARIVKATYWYFSAFDFLIPILRKRKIRWFKDTYSYYLARSPKADFHFLGHSNGTYLLGQSLLSLSGMEFKRVVLAGSVLPRNFAWQIAAQRSQISQIWNHRATSDFPVAVLCNALRGLRMRDVGTGGFDGFQVLPQICECYYHPGGHSAALTKESLNVLAAQVAGAPGVVCPHQQLVPTPPRWFERVSAMAALLPWIVLILIVAASWIFGGILASHMAGGMLGARLLVAAALLIVTGVILKFL
jgi:hypothetical protein